MSSFVPTLHRSLLARPLWNRRPGRTVWRPNQGSFHAGTDCSVTVTILLIRHAAHVELGQILSGRRRDVALSNDGLEQAEIVADLLSVEPLAAVYSSPLDRTPT